MNNRKFNEIDIAEVFTTAGNAKLELFLKSQLIESSENLNWLQEKKIDINII